MRSYLRTPVAALGGADPWTPATLPSLAAWYTADPTYLRQERTGAAATTPASADGDPVGTILDQSGNGRHFTAGSDAMRGTLRVVGGKPCVRFDGVNDGYLTPAFQTFPSKRGACWVALNKPAVEGGGYGTILSTFDGTDPDWQWTYWDSGKNQQWYDGAASRVYDTAAIVSGLHRFGFNRTADAAFDGWRDGVKVTSGAALTDNQPASNVVALGVNAGSSEPAGMDLYAVVMTGATVSDADAALLDAWLAGLM